MRLYRAPLLLALSLWGSTARAELPGDCTQLGAALVEHSCFHAVLGPFTQVAADPGITAPEHAPEVDPVHTYYDVVLPDPLGENTLSYRVAAASRAGVWAVFLDPEIPLRVLDEDGGEIASLLEVETRGCPSLPRALVYELADQRYRFVLGPATKTHGLLVIENISDFLTFNGIDRDGDGYGDPSETLETPCEPPEGYAPNDRDCDDADPNVHPGVVERCDGIDQNCNGLVDDEGFPCDVGLGRCKTRGKTSCMGERAVCEAEAPAPEPEGCDGVDQDCDGVEDLEESGLCGVDNDAPRCVRVLGEVRCGCDSDPDCGGARSGRVCNLETRRCESGCVALPGRNGCAPPEVCTSADPAHVGRCAILENGLGEPDSNDAKTPLEDRAGCGCRIPPSASSAGASRLGLSLLALGLAVWCRRKRAL